MDAPTMFPSQVIAEKTTALVSYFPLPGLGVLPIQAFLIDGVEPVLVDTGMANVREDFLSALHAAIDPARLRWIVLTHIDLDHVGNLVRVMEDAPRARIVTTYLGMGKLALLEIPSDRVFLLNPGQHLDLADRQLVALRPPTFDAPETTAFFDTRTRTLFSADAFGALLQMPAENAAEIPPPALQEGQVLWATIDAPWLPHVQPGWLEDAQARIRALAPRVIASCHLPPAAGMHDTLLQYLEVAVTARPFVGPDQAELERILGVAPAPATARTIAPTPA